MNDPQSKLIPNVWAEDQPVSDGNTVNVKPVSVSIDLDIAALAASIAEKLRDGLAPVPIMAGAVCPTAAHGLVCLTMNPPEGGQVTLAEIENLQELSALFGRLIVAGRVAWGDGAACAVALHVFAVAFLGWPPLIPYPVPQRPQ